MRVAPNVYVASDLSGPLRQGEILSNVHQVRAPGYRPAADSTVEIEVGIHSYAIVVSQDCDLDWDYKARFEVLNPNKELPNILLCPLKEAEIMSAGPGMDPQDIRLFRSNRSDRFYFFQRVEKMQDAQSNGLPELGTDFKRYLTIPSDELYVQIGSGAIRRSRLITPYLEHFCLKFAQHLSRIALPEAHFSE